MGQVEGPNILYRIKESDRKICTKNIKIGTEPFDDDHFPCRKQNCSRQYVWNLMKIIRNVST